MPEDREEWIANRAYELWEAAGKPDGQDHEHWAQASLEWETRQPPSEPAQTSPRSWDEEGHGL